MTTEDRDQDGGAFDADEEETDEEEGPPYSRLDPDTAARCGLWLETE